MPWSIKERDGRFCVVKNDGGKVVHCYSSHAEADKLLKALYANAKDFSSELTPTETADYQGKIFEVGLFLDKNFSLSLSEMADAIAEFEPVEIDLEHKNTIFDGKLGKLESISFDDSDFNNLHGKARLPIWLSNVIGNDPIKVSCRWDTDRKRLTKLSLVRDPRIEDAKLSAAFASSTEDSKMPELDEETRKGILATIKEYFAEFGKGTPPPSPPAAEIPKIAEVPPPPTPNADFAKLQTQMEELRAQNFRIKAEGWADATIAGGYASPAQREKMVAAFSAAQKADLSSGTADFSGDGGEAVKAVKDLFTEKQHSFFSEEMPADLNYLDSAPPLDKLQDEEVKRLLGATNSGRAVLREAEGK